MRQLPRVRAAWGAGWAVYLVAAVLWSYDGLLSVIFQPICAAVVSTIGVGVVLLAGLILLVPPIGRLWHSRPTWVGVVVAASLVVMCFGSTVGLTADYVDPETGRKFAALHPAAALLSYFILLFALAHWPGWQPQKVD